MWERITSAVASLGPAAEAMRDGEAAALAGKTEEELIEYEGMLITAAAAQRRR